MPTSLRLGMSLLGLVALSLTRSSLAVAAPTGPGARPDESARDYHWPRRHPGYLPLEGRFPAPSGCERVDAPPGSYAAWLRRLPLLPPGRPVRAFDGRLILPGDHPSLAAVVDLDVGRADRQQCVDTIIRLRGEYLFARGQAASARFLWSGATRFGYVDWRAGLRPTKRGRAWVLERKAASGDGYASFRRYLEHLASWTGTQNHVAELRPAAPSVASGDFFIQGGSPGHAVILLDLARCEGGKLRALVGQGFMPAQDLHVLRFAESGPWFALEPPPASLATPFWRPFRWTDLRRFRY